MIPLSQTMFTLSDFLQVWYRSRNCTWLLLGSWRYVVFKSLAVTSCPQPTVAYAKREMYRFSSDLAKLALRIAERYGSLGEKWFAPLPRKAFHIH